MILFCQISTIFFPTAPPIENFVHQKNLSKCRLTKILHLLPSSKESALVRTMMMNADGGGNSGADCGNVMNDQ